jgi:hypothetical protein
MCSPISPAERTERLIGQRPLVDNRWLTDFPTENANQPHGVIQCMRAVELDGVKQAGNEIARMKDGKLHHVRVVMG